MSWLDLFDSMHDNRWEGEKENEEKEKEDNTKTEEKTKKKEEKKPKTPSSNKVLCPTSIHQGGKHSKAQNGIWESVQWSFKFMMIYP